MDKIPHNLFDASGYADVARAEGFDPDEIEGFEDAARRAHMLGITPENAAIAIAEGRIVYDFESGTVQIDGK